MGAIYTGICESPKKKILLRSISLQYYDFLLRVFLLPVSDTRTWQSHKVDNKEFKIPVHVMTCTPKLQVQVHVPVEGLFS